MRVADLRRVEREVWDDSADRWYVWDGAGRRLRLIGDYGNPAEKFAEAVMNLNGRVRRFDSRPRLFGTPKPPA